MTDPFAGLVLRADATIRQAMESISANSRDVVLVQDETARIVGLITDGDIRRGLLRGLTLDSPAREVMTRDFVAVSPAQDRAAVLDLMKARAIRHVPVLDRDRRLHAIHFLADLIGGTRKPNRAVIMAGGKGTRLRPFTETLPKPMVAVAGRPILERIVLHLVGHGIDHIYLSVNFLAHVIEQHFGDGSAFGCRIEYLREDVPLGTGGALALLPQPVEHPIVVLNGDQITDTDITALLEAHAQSGCEVTVAAGAYQVQIPFGTITEEDGRLIAIEEKPTVDFLVNRGIYVVDPAVLPRIPRGQDYPITQLFDQMLDAKRPINVFYSNDYWLDIGRPEDLHRANGRQ